MKIEKFLPSTALLPFVKEFIIIECERETDSKTLPDTSMVMTFRYRGCVLNKQGDQEETLPTTAIAGLKRTSRLFSYATATANLLVIFNEGGFSAFCSLPANELFDLTISSGNLFRPSELTEVVERLAEAKTHPNRIRLIEAFLLSKLTHRKPDWLISHAIQRIKKQKGIVRIKELAASFHISQDPFEKRFRKVVGSTPKQFASVIRLRNLVGTYSSYSTLTEASYEAGYFDQSHFIKDFRLFAGQAPNEFFKSPMYW